MQSDETSQKETPTPVETVETQPQPDIKAGFAVTVSSTDDVRIQPLGDNPSLIELLGCLKFAEIKLTAQVQEGMGFGPVTIGNAIVDHVRNLLNPLKKS